MNTSKREQIEKAAMQLFLQHGYRETSMDQVAALAGVSKHTIYNHFQSKEGLFVALVEQFIGKQFHGEGNNLESQEAHLGLRQLTDRVVSKMNNSEYVAFLRLLIAESGHFPDLAQLFISKVIGQESNRLKQYFESHPELEIPEPDLTAYIVVSSISSFMLVQELMEGQAFLSIDSQRLLDRLVNLILS